MRRAGGGLGQKRPTEHGQLVREVLLETARRCVQQRLKITNRQAGRIARIDARQHQGAAEAQRTGPVLVHGVVCRSVASLEKQVKAGTDVFDRRLGAHTDGRRDALRVGDGEGTLSDSFVEDKVLLAPQKQLATIVRPGQVSEEHGIGADGDGRRAAARHQAGAAIECNGRADDVATLAACFGVNR